MNWEKRSGLLIPVVLVIAVHTSAGGSSFTLRQKVDASHSVLVLTITQIERSTDQQTNAATSAEADVLEVLKGPANLKKARFWCASQGDFARAASQITSGKTYVAFLCQVDGKYWAFEGPAGLRPVSNEYQEKRPGTGREFITETLSHTNYLDAIRTFASVPKVSISQLLKYRKEYFGKRVEVTGFYRSYFEYSGLYERKQDMDRFVENPKVLGAIHNGLWIDPFAKPGYADKIKFVKQGWVRIVGVFSYHHDPTLGVGHNNGWPAQLISLELFEPIQ